MCVNDEEIMKLTDKEQNIILATIRIWNVNEKMGYVPDYNLIANFGLTIEEMVEIRDLIQQVKGNRGDIASFLPK